MKLSLQSRVHVSMPEIRPLARYSLQRNFKLGNALYSDSYTSAFCFKLETFLGVRCSISLNVTWFF